RGAARLYLLAPHRPVALADGRFAGGRAAVGNRNRPRTFHRVDDPEQQRTLLPLPVRSGAPVWLPDRRRDFGRRHPADPDRNPEVLKGTPMGILWTIIIGFVAGIIAKFLHPGSNEPSGFILTTLLGIAGAFVATYVGQALGFYQANEGAGLIGAVVGAIIVLVVWGMFAPRDAR